MKLLCFEEWLECYGMGEVLIAKEDSTWKWLSNAYEEYVSYAEDRAYDEWEERINNDNNAKIQG